MPDWTVVATTHPENYQRGMQLLEQFGRVDSTDYFNVLVLSPNRPEEFLERFATMVANVPEVLEALSRVVPAEHCFEFETPEDFERQALEVVVEWIPRLRGRSFHVRMHRRGYKGQLSSQTEEKSLDAAILAGLEEIAAPGRIDFADPDAVIDVETVGSRACISFWTREEITRYPFLRID